MLTLVTYSLNPLRFIIINQVFLKIIAETTFGDSKFAHTIFQWSNKIFVKRLTNVSRRRELKLFKSERRRRFELQ